MGSQHGIAACRWTAEAGGSDRLRGTVDQGEKNGAYRIANVLAGASATGTRTSVPA